MSYILDALKKSEAEANPDAAATLALNQHVRGHERRRQYVLGTLIIAALLLNAAALLWVLRPAPRSATQIQAPAAQSNEPAAQSNEPAAQNNEPAAQNNEPAGVAAMAAAKPPAPSPADPARRSPAPAARPATAAPAQTMARPAQQPIRVDQLPAAVRDRFPEIEFSTHVYAEDPELRAVVANGERLKEGDFLGEIEVRRITDDGVLVRFEGYLVRLSVLEDWDLP